MCERPEDMCPWPLCCTDHHVDWLIRVVKLHSLLYGFFQKGRPFPIEKPRFLVPLGREAFGDVLLWLAILAIFLSYFMHEKAIRYPYMK